MAQIKRIVSVSALVIFVFLSVTYRESFRLSSVSSVITRLCMTNRDIENTFHNDSRASVKHHCNIAQAEMLGHKYTQLLQQKWTWSGCYSHDYLLQFYQADVDNSKSQNVLIFDVGANKGYSMATWISLWLPQSGINPHTLHKFLQNTIKIQSCGVCNDCNDVSFDKLNLTVDTSKSIEIHAFEPQPSTYLVLNQVRQWMKIPNIHIHFLALSNRTGVGLLQKCIAGAEACGLSTTVTNNSDRNNFVEVNITTLDRFVESHMIFRHIDILKIDTEGFDPLVLLGAENVLRRHQVRLLLFEYHGVGIWQTTSLYQVVADLDEKGYICYQIGQTGLFRLSGCWSQHFELKRWSNVLCISRKESKLITFIKKLLVEI